MDKLIAKKYAKALMESGDEATVSGRLEMLGAIAEAFEDPRVHEVIASPLVPRAQKAELALAALGKDADGVLAKLVELMAQKDRLGLIPDVVDIVAFERKKASNRFEGTIYSDETLSEATVSKLEQSLATYSGAEIKLDQAQSDQAGMKVEVEDLGIELSFSREKVKHALIDHIQKAL
jgi:F-type H+-transporting ATPase subunit delta